MVTIIIVDDEPKARETIVNVLKNSPLEIDIIGQADSIQSAARLIQQFKPDLLLLDINLPDGSGFDLLSKLGSSHPAVIFITAYEAFAIKAIKFSAMDYILKPFTTSELIEAVKKASCKIENEKSGGQLKTLLSNLDKIRRIVIRTSECLHVVNIKDIVRLEADGNYTSFHLSNGEKLLVSKTLKEYDELLEDSGFFRTHQSHLINLEHLLRYEKADGGYLVMKDNSSVPISIRKKDSLFRLFDQMRPH